MQSVPRYDTETVQLLRRVLEDAAQALPDEPCRQQSKALLASRILALAATGERDPVRLGAAALRDLPLAAMPEVSLVPGEEPFRCRSCGAEMRLVFKGPNPFRSQGGEIREYHCHACAVRTTLRWPAPR